MSHSPFLLAAALVDRDPSPDPARLLEQALAAEDAGLDLVTIEPGPADPLIVAARLAAQTSRIGIVPVVPATTSEPFHVSTGVATIDVVAAGRAGWLTGVEDPALVGSTVTWDVPDDVAGDAAEHVEVVRALWDSWEEGAVIRDVATDRFLDRELVHHVDFRGAHLSVRGPSITPRPPQGRPPVLVRATDAATVALAELTADALVTRDEAVARGGGGPLRILEVDVDPADLDGLAGRLVALHEAGVGGVLLHAEDLVGTLAVLGPALEAVGGRAEASTDPPSTLRTRLGLGPAANRFEVHA